MTTPQEPAGRPPEILETLTWLLVFPAAIGFVCYVVWMGVSMMPPIIFLLLRWLIRGDAHYYLVEKCLVGGVFAGSFLFFAWRIGEWYVHYVQDLYRQYNERFPKEQPPVA